MSARPNASSLCVSAAIESRLRSESLHRIACGSQPRSRSRQPTRATLSLPSGVSGR